jgi:Zn-dependent protease with chaperone function
MNLKGAVVPSNIKSILDNHNFMLPDVKNSSTYGYGGGIFHEFMLFDEYKNSQIKPLGIEGIVTHELGHRKNRDHVKAMAFDSLKIIFENAILFYGVVDNTTLFQSFGFTTEPIMAAPLITRLIYHPIESLFFYPLENIMIRNIEYNADDYSASKGYTEHLFESLMKLYAPSIVYHPFFEFWNKEHPCNLNRYRAMKSHGYKNI